ncbi:MAG: hypothetical protein U0842_17855 [Candidatus Binatia bacterium]
MRRVLIVLALIAWPSTAAAELPTCRDLLVGAAPRQYECDGEQYRRGGMRVRDDAPFTVDQGAFWADPSGTTFNITFFDGPPLICACDPEENRSIVQFFRSREFTCSQPVASGGSMALHGRVTGRGGSRVVLKKTFEDGGIIASSSVVHCRPVPPSP